MATEMTAVMAEAQRGGSSARQQEQCVGDRLRIAMDDIKQLRFALASYGKGAEGEEASPLRWWSTFNVGRSWSGDRCSTGIGRGPVRATLTLYWWTLPALSSLTPRHRALRR